MWIKSAFPHEHALSWSSIFSHVPFYLRLHRATTLIFSRGHGLSASVGRFESLIPVGVHSKIGKATKPKTFKNSGARHPFVFESQVGSSGQYPLWVDTSIRK